MSRLGFGVEDLLPRARLGGALKMGLVALPEHEWLQLAPDLTARNAAFDTHPESLALTPEAMGPGRELASLLGIEGSLEQAARAHHEDMCLLSRREGEDAYRLVGATVAYPTDWHPAAKLGLRLTELHRPIDGYAEQLASGVDHFMETLKTDKIFGRCNWFVAPTPTLRWIADRPAALAFAHVTPDNAGETLFVRCERQTLRRLPRTGAIVFTIGVHVLALGELSTANVERLASAVRTIPANEAERRGARFWAPQLQAFASGRAQAIAAH